MVERGSWTGETRQEKSVEIFGFCDVYNLFMRVFFYGFALSLAVQLNVFITQIVFV